MEKFNIKPKNKLEPQRGRILIAEPFMEDPYFQRTVVLLCEHNKDGTFGFILNRFVEIEMEEVLEDLAGFEGRMGLGGPVDNSNLFYIHTLGDELEGSVHIAGNHYMGGNYDVLQHKLLTKTVKRNEVRFFVGYSGWGEKQLDQELKQESWYVSEINSLSLIEPDADTLWENALKTMGGDYANLVNFPVNPNLN